MSPRYESPGAFKHALEHRLRAASANGEVFARRRQLLVFDRFLARVVQVFGKAVMLKGGLVLELRLERARTTKDVDLRVVGPSDRVLDQLRLAGRLDLGDFLSFEVVLDPKHPDIDNDGMKYDGMRFRAECLLAGRPFGDPFGVDVAFGDPILGEPDLVVAKDVLVFAGISPPTLRLYPVETHIAEKFHAYTMPRDRENSRVKDLPDLALLALVRPIESDDLRRALEQTFEFRGTHPLPTAVPEPPVSWAARYERIAEQDGLPWADVAALLQAVRAFLDPILGAKAAGTWSPKTGSWG